MPRIDKGRKSRWFVVYMIRCLVSGKCYVGSTDDEVSRMNNHFRLLYKNNHHSIKLQRAYNKYGAQNFDFVICERELLESGVRQAERNWINRENSFLNGYNMTNYTGQGTTIPASQIQKMRASAKRIGQDPELRLKRSLQAKKQHAEGKFNYRKRVERKYKFCKFCGVEFELERKSTGQWRENKLCHTCSVNCKQATRR